MKKILSTLAALLLLAPAVLTAQRTSTKTHFAGDRITGVAASSAFDVVLVKSDRTRAVIEVNDFIERYVQISRSGDGIVTIGLRDMDRLVNRRLNTLSSKERVMRLTLYLPEVNTLRLSGASELFSSDSFPGENVDIQLSGASEVNDFELVASRVKLQCSGASEVSLRLPATRDLVVVASGASEIGIVARGLTYSRLGVSGASDVEIEGDGQRGEWTASGASQIDGEEFALKELNITASGASSARVNVSGTLTTKTSGGASIRYRGNPPHIDNTNSSVRPL